RRPKCRAWGQRSANGTENAMSLYQPGGSLISRRDLMSAFGVLGGAVLMPRGLRAEAAERPVRLDAKPGEAQFLPQSAPTPIWGYGGTVPGPEIRVRQGGEVFARLTNGIGEPTTIHWHGVRLENAM